MHLNLVFLLHNFGALSCLQITQGAYVKTKNNTYKG